MIPSQNTKQNDGLYLSSSNSQSEMGVEISEEIYGLFASKVYNQKIAAVVREYICNAVDSHIEAGVASPIDVTLPNDIENIFSVRDYGLGLDEEGVRHVFSTFLKSTKKDKEKPTGFLGIGSKSAYSYVDTFTIIAIKDGVKRTFIAFINEKNVPTLDMVSHTHTENGNGLEVRIAVQRHDFAEFRATTEYVSSFISVPVNIIGDSDGISMPEARKSLDERGVYLARNVTPSRNLPSLYRDMRGKIGIVMGGVVYPTNISEVISLLRDSEEETVASLLDNITNKFYSNTTDVYVEVGMGDVEFSFSRENLSMTEATKVSIVHYVSHAIKDLIRETNEEISHSSHVVEAHSLVYEKLGCVVPLGFSYGNTDVTRAMTNCRFFDYMNGRFMSVDIRGVVRQRPVATTYKHLYKDGVLVINDTNKTGGLKWTKELLKNNTNKYRGKTFFVQNKKHNQVRNDRILAWTGMDVLYLSDIIPDKKETTSSVSSRGEHLIRAVRLNTVNGEKLRSDVVDVSNGDVVYIPQEKIQYIGSDYHFGGDTMYTSRSLVMMLKDFGITTVVVRNTNNTKKIEKNEVPEMMAFLMEKTKGKKEEYINQFFKGRMQNMAYATKMFDILPEYKTPEVEDVMGLFSHKTTIRQDSAAVQSIARMHMPDYYGAIKEWDEKRAKVHNIIHGKIFEDFPLLCYNGFSGTQDEVDYILALKQFKKNGEACK